MLRSFSRPNGPHPTARAALAVVLAVAACVSTLQAVRTSTTFDESYLVAAGARTLAIGDDALLLDQPPLMAMLYGLGTRVGGTTYPETMEARRWTPDERWEHARTFFFRSGLDPERVALSARLVGIVALVLLGLLTWSYTRWIVAGPGGRRVEPGGEPGVGGEGAALVATTLVVLLPDAVAHAAVAYNDLPLALLFLAAVGSIDRAVREPGPLRGALAGSAVALAMGVKFSALALAPVALLLVGAESMVVPRERLAVRARSLAGAVAAGCAAAYLVTVALYGGDWLLLDLEYGLRFTVTHAAEGHEAPAYLFGATRPEGWWYFFPAAFLVKTPGALHAMMPFAAIGLIAGAMRGAPPAARDLLSSRLRGPVAAAAVFGAFLLSSDLNAGFRYALPLMPPLLILVSVGLTRLWEGAALRRRLGLALLVLLYAGSTLSAAPWFLSYRSEWFRGRAAGNEALVDSSLDWGQGLLALREWMQAAGVERVHLGYFGSALPSGYGIEYEPMPSFLPLPPASGEETSTTVVVSATNLHGLYLPGDPYAALRGRTPDRILGGSLYVYRGLRAADPVASRDR